MKAFLLGAVLMVSTAAAQISDQIDSLLADYNGPNPGASLLVIKDGTKILEKCFGMADIEEGISVTPQTNFRLASVTKQFTAAAILKLINEHKLNLSTTLIDIWPDFPEYGREITIENLLNHTSGLIDYESLIPDTASVQVTDEDVLTMMKNVDSVYFPTGTKHQYSNTGYAVLSKVVEKISGKKFGAYLQDEIFLPLGMNNTIAYESGINEVNNRAYGNVRTNPGWLKKDQSLTSAVLGDGGVYSSLEDLYKWDQSLYTDIIIPDELRVKSFTRIQLSSGELIDYGFGWRLSKLMNEEVVYHTGSTIGGRTIIYRIPSKKFTIIFLSNRDEGDTLKIAETIAGYYLETF